jgi:hypothetical protein
MRCGFVLAKTPGGLALPRLAPILTVSRQLRIGVNNKL